MKNEIEIKFSLNEEDNKTFLQWIKQNAKFEKEELQEEIYFEDPTRPFLFKNNEGMLDADKYLRVRFSDQKSEVTFKDWKRDPDNPKKSTHCEEYEFTIDDPQEGIKFLNALGYTNEYNMKKLRKKYTYKNFEIVHDEILEMLDQKDFGTFFEIEIEDDEKDVKASIEKIYSLLRQIGINTITIYNRGYISWVLNPDFDFSEVVRL